MGGSAAVRAEGAFRLGHTEAFAEPAYGETAGDVAAASARCEDGEPVGMAYGWPLASDRGGGTT